MIKSIVSQAFMLLVLVFVLLGCGTGSKITKVGVSNYPQLLMSNDTIVAWDITQRDKKTELYELKHSVMRNIGDFDNPGLWNRSIDSGHFASMLVSSSGKDVSARNKQIYIYNIANKSRRLLINNARIDTIPQPTSPKGSSILVYLEKPIECLAAVDVNNGITTILLKDVWPLDAAWTTDGKSILCAATKSEKPDEIVIYRISVHDRSAKNLWNRRFNSVSGLRCSPDGDHIVYQVGKRLICESLSSRHKWIVVSDSAGDIDCIWSQDGRKLAVLLDGKETHLVIFDASLKKSTNIELGNNKRLFFPIGWLSDNRTFLLNASSLKSGEHEIWKVTGDGKGTAVPRL